MPVELSVWHQDLDPVLQGRDHFLQDLVPLPQRQVDQAAVLVVQDVEDDVCVAPVKEVRRQQRKT